MLYVMFAASLMLGQARTPETAQVALRVMNDKPVHAEIFLGVHDVSGDAVFDAKDIELMQVCLADKARNVLNCVPRLVEVTVDQPKENTRYFMMLGALDYDGDGKVNEADLAIMKKCLEKPNDIDGCRSMHPLPALERRTAVSGTRVVSDEPSTVEWVTTVAIVLTVVSCVLWRHYSSNKPPAEYC